MKRIAVFLLMGVWALAIAQTPPGDEPADAIGQAVPCVSTGEAGVTGDEEEDTGLPSEPCVEPDLETVPDGDQLSAQAPAETVDDAMGIEAEVDGVIDENNLPTEVDGVIEENILPTEASVEEEFKPGDEISEDYPVPLPADI